MLPIPLCATFQQETEIDHSLAKLKKAMKQVIRMLVFVTKSLPGKLVVDDRFVNTLYATSHAENCKILELQGVKPETVVWFLHAVSSWGGLYEMNSDTVHMVGKNSQRAIAELKLVVLTLAQDDDAENYVLKEGSSTYEHTPPGEIELYCAVPGVKLSQLAAPNQALLRGAAVVLAGLSEDDRVPYCPSVTANGTHGDKPAYFHTEPVFLGGWPS